MDDAQAAAVLRTASDCIPKFKNIEIPMTDVVQACSLGADALEFKAWLLTPTYYYWPIVYGLWHNFPREGANGQNFLAYCEARFEEHKKGLTK